MQGWFIVTIVFAILAGVAWLITLALRPEKQESSSDREELKAIKFGARVIAGAITFIALAFLGFSSVTMVPTKTVGVVVSYGKPVGVISNGLHVIAPWQKVVEFDAAVQTLKRTGDKSCTTVRIANQATACVDNSTRWRIKPEAAPDLYTDYKSFSNLRDSLVNRELTSVLNSVFADYDPLAAVDETANPKAGEYQLGTMSDEATKMLKERVGSKVEVMSVVLPIVRFDGTTQSKLDGLQAAKADTRISEQRKETNQNEAEANNALTSSLTQDILTSKCLDLVREIYKDGKEIPAGFSCFPGGGVPVIANAK